jgi:hypothetical protein
MKPNITSETKRIDVLPMVKHYISELGLYEIFKKYIPKRPNAYMEPAQILFMMIVNIICATALYTRSRNGWPIIPTAWLKRELTHHNTTMIGLAGALISFSVPVGTP